MAHQRQVIRHAIRDALLGETDAEDRVYATRVLSLRKASLPVLAIYTLEESVDGESATTAPRELTREMPVVIEGWVAPAANTDDAMDALAEQIEEAMHADPYLGGAVGDSVLDDTVLEVVHEGDRLMGLVALTYSVTYRTMAPAAPADADIDDFNTAHATYNLGGGVHEDDDAEDQITVQEAEA